MPRRPSLDVSAAAAALGRLGGSKTSPQKARAAAQNGARTRFTTRYRLTPSGDVERLTDGRWRRLQPPYDQAAMRWIYRQRQAG